MSSKQQPAKSARRSPKDKTSINKRPRRPLLPVETVLDFQAEPDVASELERIMRQASGMKVVKITADDRKPKSSGPSLAPGESIVDITAQTTLYKPDGWDM